MTPQSQDSEPREWDGEGAKGGEGSRLGHSHSLHEPYSPNPEDQIWFIQLQTRQPPKTLILLTYWVFIVESLPVLQISKLRLDP